MNRNHLVMVSVLGLAFSASVSAKSRGPANAPIWTCSDETLGSAANETLGLPAVLGAMKKSGGLPTDASKTWVFGQIISMNQHTSPKTGTITKVYTVQMYNQTAEDYSLNAIITAQAGCKITNTWIDVSSLDGG